ncbi:MAG: hypothetical protein Q4F00_05390 [bacterium]|nr:hypothetical protein [bacterium]
MAGQLVVKRIGAFRRETVPSDGVEFFLAVDGGGAADIAVNCAGGFYAGVLRGIGSPAGGTAGII